MIDTEQKKHNSLINNELWKLYRPFIIAYMISRIVYFFSFQGLFSWYWFIKNISVDIGFMIIILIQLLRYEKHKESISRYFRVEAILIGFFIINSLSISCAILLDICVFQKITNYMGTVSGAYNLFVFIIYLMYLAYLRKSNLIGKNSLYLIFFLVYCFASISSITPPTFRRILLSFVPMNGYLNAMFSFYYPAIKESILAFIILDTTDLLSIKRKEKV